MHLIWDDSTLAKALFCSEPCAVETRVQLTRSSVLFLRCAHRGCARTFDHQCSENQISKDTAIHADCAKVTRKKYRNTTSHKKGEEKINSVALLCKRSFVKRTYLGSHRHRVIELETDWHTLCSEYLMQPNVKPEFSPTCTKLHKSRRQPDVFRFPDRL